jgi:flagellar L-ring protein precursor FlgH
MTDNEADCRPGAAGGAFGRASGRLWALWRSGSRAVFKDQHAAQVGDIVTVLVNITDAADLKDNTAATRSGNESMGLPNLFGFEATIPKILAGANPSSLVAASSGNGNTATAELQRNETVTLRLAGVITQVLPNGNLVVSAPGKRRDSPAGHRQRQHGAARPHGGGAHFLWRPGGNIRRAVPALGPAGIG